MGARLMEETMKSRVNRRVDWGQHESANDVGDLLVVAMMVDHRLAVVAWFLLVFLLLPLFPLLTFDVDFAADIDGTAHKWVLQSQHCRQLCKLDTFAERHRLVDRRASLAFEGSVIHHLSSLVPTIDRGRASSKGDHRESRLVPQPTPNKCCTRIGSHHRNRELTYGYQMI